MENNKKSINVNLLQAHIEALRKIAKELKTPRYPNSPPRSLSIHAERSVVQAAKIFLTEADAGTINYKKTLTAFIGGNSTADSPDDALLGEWVYGITTWLRSQRPTFFKADAGAFDLSAFKLDATGKPIIRDGNAIRVTEDYTDENWRDHYQDKFDDWGDACLALISLLENHLALQGEETANPPKGELSALPTTKVWAQRTAINYRNAGEKGGSMNSGNQDKKLLGGFDGQAPQPINPGRPVRGLGEWLNYLGFMVMGYDAARGWVWAIVLQEHSKTHGINFDGAAVRAKVAEEALPKLTNIGNGVLNSIDTVTPFIDGIHEHLQALGEDPAAWETRLALMLRKLNRVITVDMLSLESETVFCSPVNFKYKTKAVSDKLTTLLRDLGPMVDDLASVAQPTDKPADNKIIETAKPPSVSKNKGGRDPLSQDEIKKRCDLWKDWTKCKESQTFSTKQDFLDYYNKEHSTSYDIAYLNNAGRTYRRENGAG